MFGRLDAVRADSCGIRRLNDPMSKEDTGGILREFLVKLVPWW
jgi:hypothetical protein